MTTKEKVNQRPYRWPASPIEAWSIGVYQGKSPFELQSVDHANNPVLTRYDITDVNASFVADPFIILENGQYYMFLEIKNLSTRKGDIGLAISKDGIKWAYQKVVLVEPFHLSYSYVFKYEDTYYMVPETLGAEAVRLYKSIDFPYQWEFVTNLIEGKHADPTVFYHEGRWWMFTCPKPFQHDILHLYYADTLTGPWKEHPQNPILENDASSARPGGRPIFYNGKWIRFAQDCSQYYGMQVRAFEINKLTPFEYKEKEINSSPILSYSGKGWNGKGMHHIDAIQQEDDSWLAVVDGRYLNI